MAKDRRIFNRNFSRIDNFFLKKDSLIKIGPKYVTPTIELTLKKKERKTNRKARPGWARPD